MRILRKTVRCAAMIAAACITVHAANAQAPSDFPPFEKVSEGYEKVVSTADGKASFYTIWIRKKDGQMLAELPRQFSKQKHFISLTVASGERFAGLQAGDMYVYWRQYDKRLALIEPNLSIRSSGDKASQDSVKRLFTDRVILDVPIVTYVPRGGPVIDMDALLVGQASKFFGSRVRISNPRLASIAKAKAFPKNVELAFEVPTSNGRLQTLHYSISNIEPNPGYKPRLADQRVGYFTTSHSDYGKFKEDETRVRYINRWHLVKADPSLKMSPPVKPIKFYIEHTTPIRYRRWVRQGVLYWNKAFEKVGFTNAIEVEYQDSNPKAPRNMDLDPEDARYNFIRWLNNDVGTAIGPSRVNPLTGEILDADIILTDGWIRHYWEQFNEIMPALAIQGFSVETLNWLDQNPNWDPRVRLAPPSQREYLIEQAQRRAAQPFGSHPVSSVDPKLIGDDEYDGLIGRISQINGMCLAARGRAFDLALARMTMSLAAEAAKDEEKSDDDKDKEKKEEKKEEEKKKEEKKKEDNLIDGMPEAFIGPLLAELVAHEVGHTLGLRHNFKSSSIYTLADINSEKVKGKKPYAGSVMDYLPINMNPKSSKVKGDYTMIGVGPYDHWAIEYGYTTSSDLKPILARVSEPELAYATDEDTGGPDPLARRYDFGKDPLSYANKQMQLVKNHRKQLVEKFVKEGDSWSKARKGYELTLAIQTRAVSMMANWVGGAHVNRDKKGDKGNRVPIQVVPAKDQRNALKFVINNVFVDEAFGLSPELLERMSVDKWLDGDGFRSAFSDEATWPIHDRIMGIQSSALTMLMNPTTLRRVYDNEYRIPAKEDALTLPELLDTLTKAIWSELEKAPEKQFTARQPMISSLRRNLQREHLERLVDLIMPGTGFSAAYKPISDLALFELRELVQKLSTIDKNAVQVARMDPYTRAHLTQVRDNIEKALAAEYIYNAKDLRGGRSVQFLLLGDENKKPEAE